MRGKSDTLARLADAQHGVVARRQLLAIGLSSGAIDRRLGDHRLRPLHAGVYAVGHKALTREGRWMAATLACGGVLSHQTAASAWDLRPSDGAIHVTVSGTTLRARRGVRVHRSAFEPHDLTTHRGIPLTTPVRTILDLSATLDAKATARLVDRAERLIDFAELRRRGRSRSLKAVLSHYAPPALTRSELEQAFLALCDDHGIPRPRTNAFIEGFEVDFAWPARRLVVEVDGYAFHRSPAAFAADRERDVILALAGWRVLRFTYEQVTRRAGWVASVLQRLE